MWWLVAALYKRQIYLWIEVKLSVESRSTATVISAVIGCGPREVLLTQSTSNHQSPPHGVLPLDLGIFTPSYLQIGCNKKTSLLCIPIFLGILVTSHSKVHWRCFRRSAHPKASSLPRGLSASLEHPKSLTAPIERKSVLGDCHTTTHSGIYELCPWRIWYMIPILRVSWNG